MATLSARNLAKAYKSRQVVRDVSLSVSTGQIVGLLGPNGAGKTTTFYMIVGLVPLDKGAIEIDDNELTHQPMHERARRGIGYLPQEASIFRKLTVHENIMAILQTRKDLNSQQQEEEADALLDEFNINHIRNSTGMSLSGGERRRVEIARALAAKPQFILLDEPFAGVDPISVNDIKKIIQHLRDRGIGILITDHNVRETLDVCEKAYIVSHGELIAQGTAEQVLSNQKVRDVYLGEQFRL
ncbi:LPS export ABC transporter ATP-binding protein [Alteromonas sp. McT4-15]|jgi:lipopolysaccharide export system ATP-binding protein|uniref:LPS export ABC transporter ATP-binding protein n=1 Tax=unclassified Alteromonas TaxID=2614992 RepID=UPI0012E489C5|nr:MULTISPECIES: LPS export ABC transporter ATP-binding protein [unclassified Alteromonas]GFD88395.1 ABC transporter ATP-binding protein [Tenacibaculum sp. KUL152]MCB4436116.1 LPS export ABC transporter ATP-binding protein [Alteromonas sp. McT4-15]WDT86866.1 LPS export ABC transporter ATP-binding protein [Alteromonas sp. 009811495]BCO17860.1 ABC transporter ATP-binding protein [Alteromonas sp. KC3]BCO21821.1 ABC transporter ATP-binding protein [Alteromonas sp. KC14]